MLEIMHIEKKFLFLGHELMYASEILQRSIRLTYASWYKYDGLVISLEIKVLQVYVMYGPACDNSGHIMTDVKFFISVSK